MTEKYNLVSNSNSETEAKAEAKAKTLSKPATKAETGRNILNKSAKVVKAEAEPKLRDLRLWSPLS